jgi:hypothetical protein
MLTTRQTEENIVDALLLGVGITIAALTLVLHDAALGYGANASESSAAARFRDWGLIVSTVPILIALLSSV